jgi:hypothetical protein
LELLELLAHHLSGEENGNGGNGNVEARGPAPATFSMQPNVYGRPVPTTSGMSEERRKEVAAMLSRGLPAGSRR